MSLRSVHSSAQRRSRSGGGFAAPVLGAALAVIGCRCTREVGCCARLSEEQASS